MKNPIFVSPDGKLYECLGWAICMKNSWEWYGFEDVGNNEYFGFVHGDDDEFGYFSVSELLENGIRFITSAIDLNEIMPPVGWTKLEE
jgi:hypothetical protein